MIRRVSIKVKLIIALIIAYIIGYIFLSLSSSGYNLGQINTVFWLLVATLSYFLIGYVKNRKVIKKDTIQLVIIYSFIYLILTYLLGLYTGFAATPFSLKILIVLQNIFPVIIYIVSRELSRYIILDKIKDSKLLITLVTMLFIIVDIITTTTIYSFGNLNAIFRFIGITLIGNIFKNVLLSYSSLNVGPEPSTIYCLILEGYVYFVPFVPNLGVYLESIALLFLHVFLIIHLNKIYEKEKKLIAKNRKYNKYYYIPLFMIVLLVVSLVSGIFKYRVFAIASNSMKPVFSRGDAVIIEKFNKEEKEEIQTGDIVAFVRDNAIIVHRVVKIRKYNNELYYTTKGDANNVNDGDEIKEKDILGKVQFIVPFVGYPSLWVIELL